MDRLDRYSIAVVEEPEEEPVSLAEAKLHLQVDDDFTADDALINLEIAAARLHLEKWLTFTTTQWCLRLDRWPGDREIVLTRPPVQQVDVVEYLDVDGAWQTLAADQYQVSAGRQPPRIWPAYSKSWPSLRCQPEAVKVTYTAGYASAADVPANAKQALLLLIAHLYEHRSPVITGTIVSTMPKSIDNLMAGLQHRWRG